jgi:hypothetical protein
MLMQKLTIVYIALAVMTLALGTTTTTLAWAQVDHGDTVSTAAGIIGPELKESAQLQKDPGSVSDPAQIIGPDISAIAKPKAIEP